MKTEINCSSSNENFLSITVAKKEYFLIFSVALMPAIEEKRKTISQCNVIHK